MREGGGRRHHGAHFNGSTAWSQGRGEGGVGLGRAMRRREKERRGQLGVDSWIMQSRWLWATLSEVAARARGGGGLVNKGRRRGRG
jgi:hypothetical protein